MIDDFNITDDFPDLTPFGPDEIVLDDSEVDGMDEYMEIHFVGFRVDGARAYVAIVIPVKAGSRLDIDETQVSNYRDNELAIGLSASPQARSSNEKVYVEVPREEFTPGWPLTFTASRQGKRGTWKYTKAHAF
jgi:hypothetical protein